MKNLSEFPSKVDELLTEEPQNELGIRKKTSPIPQRITSERNKLEASSWSHFEEF